MGVVTIKAPSFTGCIQHITHRASFLGLAESEDLSKFTERRSELRSNTHRTLSTSRDIFQVLPENLRRHLWIRQTMGRPASRKVIGSTVVGTNKPSALSTKATSRLSRGSGSMKSLEGGLINFSIGELDAPAGVLQFTRPKRRSILAGGHRAGDVVYYTGTTQYRYGCACRIVGDESPSQLSTLSETNPSPPARFIAKEDGRVRSGSHKLRVLFEGGATPTYVLLTEISRDKPGPIPGELSVGAWIYWRKGCDLPDDKAYDGVRPGALGQVVGPGSASDVFGTFSEDGSIAVMFPGQQRSLECPLECIRKWE